MASRACESRPSLPTCATTWNWHCGVAFPTCSGGAVDAVLRDGDLFGWLLDTFVLAQLRGELQLGFPQPRLYHLRDRNGDHEVDLIAELDAHRLVAIEVKATAAPRLDSAS